MKVKQSPDDFFVEELTDVAPAGSGDFALYRLDKRGWSTPDALAAIRRRWRIDLYRVSCGGLKDRHAHTLQFFTILRGPNRNLKHDDIAVRYLGQVPEPFVSKDIRANRFAVTLRHLEPAALDGVEQSLAEVRDQGVPNYFDDQRFGSIGESQEFVGKALVLGDFEKALQLALAAPYEHDRAPEKKVKAILGKHWGDWAACRERLPPGHARDLADYLAIHAGDYRGAVARLRPELRGLYLSAFQSHLWNRMLARWLEEHCRPEQLIQVPLRLGKLPMHRGLEPQQLEELARLQLPLPSSRQKVAEDDPRKPLVDAVLAEEGLQLRQLQVKGIREMFFSKGERAALCLPAGLRHEAGPDELNAGKTMLRLHFELPRGAYATLMIKRIAGSNR